MMSSGESMMTLLDFFEVDFLVVDVVVDGWALISPSPISFSKKEEVALFLPSTKVERPMVIFYDCT